MQTQATCYRLSKNDDAINSYTQPNGLASDTANEYIHILVIF